MCHPAAPIAMKRGSMLVHSVRRVPPPRASSCHRISKPPQLYSSSLGASARVTLVSVTCGAGAPTVVSFTVAPTVPRLPSASKGAHPRWVGERLPDFFRRVAQFSDENERPLLSVLSYLRPAGRTRRVLLAIDHLVLLSDQRPEYVPPVGHEGRQQPHHDGPHHRVR